MLLLLACFVEHDFSTRYSNNLPPNLPIGTYSNNLVDQERRQNKPTLQGLTTSKVETMLYKSHESQVDCSICLGIFEDGEELKTLSPCNHYYHSKCVDDWLKIKKTCPLCRTPVGVDIV
ncbi:hypothetical protein LIER_22759 [Lithospermum erythrorhizon]|uniref:RING-type domain-containing protein n=1 Tax=Lithospermum erythrorhizon TaxID=34254 RepID=A0AAV3QWK0_LITER